MLHKYGQYGCEEGWAIYCQCERDLAKLMIYHLIDRLRCGDRPAACCEQVPEGRRLVEYSAAAWTPFHVRLFQDPKVDGHHREPGWLAFTDRLEQMVAQGAATPLKTLTEDVYAELMPDPMERYLSVQRKDWEADRPFGLWQYGVHGDYVALHVLNVYMPDSPFAHGAEIFAALDQIIHEIDQRGLKIVRIGVDSWINSLPPFQRFFPEQFARSLAPTTPDAKGGNGWWGQFISRTGQLHQRRAELLRCTRQFEFVRTHGECTFEALRQHVRHQVSS